MKAASVTISGRWAVLLFVVVIAVVMTAFLPPIPQPNSYHQFADARTILGIPRALDVISNLPFVVVGLVGLYLSLQPPLLELPRAQHWAWIILFGGLLLTGFGSAWYHLAPDNPRLVWDQLPMTLVMSGFLSLLLMNRTKAGIGWVLPLLTALGVFTVLQWWWSEALGHGDLRLYLLFQGLVLLCGILLLIILHPIGTEPRSALVVAVCANVAAKIFELLDKPIYSLGGLVSGHTLKHLSAGLGFIPVLLWLWARSAKPIKDGAVVSAHP